MNSATAITRRYLFDFDKPASRDLIERISDVTHMARFMIGDITDAKNIPQELQAIVPDYPQLPFSLCCLHPSTSTPVRHV